MVPVFLSRSSCPCVYRGVCIHIIIILPNNNKNNGNNNTRARVHVQISGVLVRTYNTYITIMTSHRGECHCVRHYIIKLIIALDDGLVEKFFYSIPGIRIWYPHQTRSDEARAATAPVGGRYNGRSKPRLLPRHARGVPLHTYALRSYSV